MHLERLKELFLLPRKGTMHGQSIAFSLRLRTTYSTFAYEHYMHYYLHGIMNLYQLLIYIAMTNLMN